VAGDKSHQSPQSTPRVRVSGVLPTFPPYALQALTSIILPYSEKKEEWGFFFTDLVSVYQAARSQIAQEIILLWALYISSPFQARSQNCEKRILALSCPSFLPSVRREQFVFHGAGFHKTWYLCTFRKSVEKIQVSLNSYKNSVSLHEDQYTYVIISLLVLLRMRKCFGHKLWWGKSEHEFYFLCNFFRKSCSIWLTWKNTVQPDRPQNTVKNVSCSLHAGYLRIQIHS